MMKMTSISQPAVLNRPPTQKTLFGLVTFVANIETPRDLVGAQVVVKFGDAIRTLSGNEAIETCANGLRRIQINVMTHLFPDGRYELRFGIEWPDGRRTDGQTTLWDVSNGGDLARTVAIDLAAHHTPPILGMTVDSEIFPYGLGKADLGFNDAESDVPLNLEPNADAEHALKHLRRWGFSVLPDQLPTELIAAFADELEAAIDAGRLLDARQTNERILNCHHLPSGRRIWLYPPVLAFLEQYFQDEPCACQTLTFINGSEQAPHQDTIHLTPYPGDYMCGVWVALQDVEPGSGELFVYPGSHRTPRLRAGALGLAKVKDDYSSYVTFDKAIAALLEAGGYERVLYRPKAGQILVWHENLIHGGSPRLDPGKRRLSIVSHYFAKGSVAYYDSRGEAASLETLGTLD